MAKRYVTATGKNLDGDITSLCNSRMTWSPRGKWSAISDIENGYHEYWVNWANIPETQIHVAGTGPNRYLRTDADSTTRNNLDELPDC